MSRVRVLVVSSDDDVQKTVFETLVREGIEVSSVTSAARALPMAEVYHPDLMFIDPGTSGLLDLSLVQQMRSRPETFLIPAIFLADQEFVTNRIQGFTLGADLYLPKPVKPDGLADQVHASLTRQEKTRAIFQRGGKPKDPSLSEMLATFKGSLDEMGLPALLNMMEMEAKTGTLRITLQPDGMKVRILFREGVPVQARLDGIDRPKDSDLIYFLLGTARGKFAFTAGPIIQEDGIRQSVSQLLLEGARRLDERGRRKQALPD